MPELFNAACRVCGGNRVEIFLDLGWQPHCNRLLTPVQLDQQEPRFPLRAGFCHRCTLVQIDHTIPKEEMFTDYPYVSGTTRTLVEHFKSTTARLVKQLGLGVDDLIVDIGSNDGSWLSTYPDWVRRIGVEPAANVAAIASAANIPTLNRFFNQETAAEIRQTHGSARLITAAGVFFHLEQLHDAVRGVALLLAPDGVLCIQAIYLGSMVENLAFDQIYHEHLCYYTLRSLRYLLELHGLEVFDVRILPIHGGSLEVLAASRGARPVAASVEAFGEDEQRKGLGTIDVYRQFASDVWTLGEKLVALLREFRRAGRVVYAYGAPAKGATLLNTFGIDRDLVACAVEKNPLKVGYWIPGARIPIHDEARMDRPDAYLVLAWNFLDEIVEKEGEYLQGGGTFIVPVPTVHLMPERRQVS